MTCFEDPVEGEVLVVLEEGASDAGLLRVVQSGPLHLTEVLDSWPLQSLHPVLLT